MVFWKCCFLLLTFFYLVKNLDAKTHKVPGNYVFISYSWNQKAIARNLGHCLEWMGYDIWIDTKSMYGSTLGSMASGIENCSTVIVCMSKSYQNSANCRTEGEYAYNLKKKMIPVKLEADFKATGWLGAMLGTKLYYECLTQNDVPECCSKVANALEHMGLLKANAKQGVVSASEWSNKEVINWLNKNNLTHLTTKFVDVNGKLLLELKQMYEQTPTVFYQKVDQDLGITKLFDILRFSELIEKLL